MNEAGAKMLTCAATVAGLHERTDGWGHGALVHPWHLCPLRPHCAAAAVPAFGKRTGGEQGIKLVMDHESRGRRKDPQPQSEDEELKNSPGQEFYVCHVNANQGQEITTDFFPVEEKYFSYQCAA